MSEELLNENKNESKEEADCEHVAQLAAKYGYDILCDDGVDEVAVIAKEEEQDPNCDQAAKLVKRYGYDVVCGE